MISGTITFHPKSSWQKKNCINHDAEYSCSNNSVLEAVYKNKFGHIVRVRCCRNEECKRSAALLAGL